MIKLINGNAAYACTALISALFITELSAQTIVNTGKNITATNSINDVFANRWGNTTGNPVKKPEAIVSAYAPEAFSETWHNLATQNTVSVDKSRGKNDTEIAKKRHIDKQVSVVLQPETVDQMKCGASPYDADTIRKMVENAAIKHDVDAKFAVAIAWTESRFDRTRNSPKGARGAMQLMPATAAQYGVKDICDPQDNIDAGVRHLRSLLDEFENPLLAAAAYNAGSGRVYEYQGVPPFKETIGYVAEVVNFMIDRPMPSKKIKNRNAAATVAANETSSETGVVPVQKTGTFVGGVMHF